MTLSKVPLKFPVFDLLPNKQQCQLKSSCNIFLYLSRPEKYHLFDHNCNTFSNEVAQFLTGQGIPSYIINLPHDVANTPMGAMLKTFMDGFGSPICGPTDHSSDYFSRPQQASRPTVNQSSQQQKAPSKR